MYAHSILAGVERAVVSIVCAGRLVDGIVAGSCDAVARIIGTFVGVVADDGIAGTRPPNTFV